MVAASFLLYLKLGRRGLCLLQRPKVIWVPINMSCEPAPRSYRVNFVCSCSDVAYRWMRKSYSQRTACRAETITSSQDVRVPACSVFALICMKLVVCSAIINNVPIKNFQGQVRGVRKLIVDLRKYSLKSSQKSHPSVDILYLLPPGGCPSFAGMLLRCEGASSQAPS